MEYERAQEILKGLADEDTGEFLLLILLWMSQ